ncbi:peptide ABC transporter substrate-binding protein [Acidaminobacter sp. JC074]|uniref:peptide ABC transporter substrate-binding protein n=1 Tax=Acidaminobacter sp. JC074 TaxID=2530199 RepID=UPI001F0D3EA3|nr:peptide ABC transporter substrate-binding protein [Acidaminobacter sp. JC074]
MKKFVIFILVIFLVSCVSTEEDVTSKQVLNFMLPSEPSELDPNLISETYAAAIITNTYEGLVLLAEDGSVAPGAAESWKVNDDNSEFTFYLRQNAKWSDGSPVTAEDFKDSFIRVLEESETNGALLAGYVRNGIEYFEGNYDLEVGIEVVNTYELKITTYAPTPFFLEVLTYSGFVPVPLSIRNGQDSSWITNKGLAISNGPYMVADYKKDEYLTVEKNPHYWDAENIKLDQIKFLFRANDTDIMAMYTNDEIDGIYEITASELRMIPNSEIDTYSNVLASTAYLTFNHDSDIFSNKDMRELLSIAIDREGVVAEALLGAGIVTEYFVPFQYNVEKESFRDYTELGSGQELEKAKKLLQSAVDSGTYDGRPIKWYYMLNGPDTDTTEYMIKQLERDLELSFELYQLPWAELYEVAVGGDYDILTIGWSADYPHPMTFLSTFGSNGIISKITRWYDPTYDDMIDDFFSGDFEGSILDHMKSMEIMILEDHHIAPVYYRKGLSLIDRNLKGWYRNTSSMFNFTRAYFEDN